MQPFADVLSSIIRAAGISPRRLEEGECQSPSGRRCALCHAVNLDYDTEVGLKNDALQQFWKSLRIGLHLDRLVPSPLGRNYRTITKRRVFPHRDSVTLGLITTDEVGSLRPFPVEQCAIEPAAHAAIYRRIQESIVKPYAKRLARALRYAIIKGNYNEQTVILNIDDMSMEIVRAANTLSRTITAHSASVAGVFLYEDDSRRDYYMGAANQDKLPKFKKLFGKAELYHKSNGRSFLYSPLSFSQVNQSILGPVIDKAAEMLPPSKTATLFDLYCGYGLFALCLSGGFQRVVAAEVAHASIEAAIANAKRQNVSNVRFMRSDINEETIERIMSAASPGDFVLLDTPRNGTLPGVIEHIAARKPGRVVHLFCEIDLMPKELKRWSKAGYKPTRAVPFDMFPGTASVETMVLLEQT